MLLGKKCYYMYYAGQKILAVIVCQFKKKKKKCNPYFIVIMITVLIMNVIFWVVNFKTQHYFVISTTQNVYLRLSM
jgi:F0F1-type ATP synthase membrane subunit a